MLRFLPALEMILKLTRIARRRSFHRFDPTLRLLTEVDRRRDGVGAVGSGDVAIAQSESCRRGVHARPVGGLDQPIPRILHRGVGVQAEGAVVKKLFIVAVLSCMSCSGSQPLSQCMVGFWRNPQYDGCLCPTQPECTAGDCQAIPFVGFLANGSYYSGTVSWSATGKTISIEGGATVGTYTVAGDTVQITRSAADMVTQSLTCNGSQLTINGTSRVRAEPGLAAALNGGLSTTTSFKSYPLTQ
jgi:hypothetical protein